MQPGEQGRSQEETEQAERVEPLYYKWLGEAVVINYSRGPSWLDIKDPYEVARGAIEGREALFYLEQAGSEGIGVRRLLEGEDGEEKLGVLLFLPWGAIHSIFRAEPEEQPDDE